VSEKLSGSIESVIISSNPVVNSLCLVLEFEYLSTELLSLLLWFEGLNGKVICPLTLVLAFMNFGIVEFGVICLQST